MEAFHSQDLVLARCTACQATRTLSGEVDALLGLRLPDEAAAQISACPLEVSSIPWSSVSSIQQDDGSLPHFRVSAWAQGLFTPACSVNTELWTAGAQV